MEQEGEMQAMRSTERSARSAITTTADGESGHGACPGGTVTNRKTMLDRALELIESERPREADLLLTGEILRDPRNSDLWLAAGVARIRRGCPSSASAALRMCRWLSGDPLAEELLTALPG